jgi:uncharacterized protein YndB with AHSA1/START domain
MNAAAPQATDTPVRKSITVNAPPERAFRVFAAEFDSWWPREHHIGSAPMKRTLIEGHVGGRCYAEHVDGSESDWGKILAWEPPARFVFAWRINGQWSFEPDLARSSEVEVRFTGLPGGATRVDLEHRFFARHGDGEEAMRTGVGGPGGWGNLLEMYAKKVSEGNV